MQLYASAPQALLHRAMLLRFTLLRVVHRLT